MVQYMSMTGVRNRLGAFALGPHAVARAPASTALKEKEQEPIR